MKPSELDKIRVQGGTVLNGTIPISGAKNAALKHLCASMLTGDPIQFTNMPTGLQDIRTLAALMKEMGVSVGLRSDGVAIIQANNITSTEAPYDPVRKCAQASSSWVLSWDVSEKQPSHFRVAVLSAPARLTYTLMASVQWEQTSP